MFTYLILLNGYAGRRNRERGQGLIEYTLILVLVAVVAVGALAALGVAIETEWYQDILCEVTRAFGNPAAGC